jgi:hypothetical protein
MLAFRPIAALASNFQQGLSERSGITRQALGEPPMRLIPAPNGNEVKKFRVAGSDRLRIARPTVSGMVTAGASLILLAVASVVLLIPTVFYVVPIPPHANAITLCLPGIGPLQRFRDDLLGEEEERTYIHEGVHADQCRRYGATWYARQIGSPEGRLTLESQALCAEVTVFSRRGADPGRLLDWAEETLASEYFDDGSVSRDDVALAVEAACAEVSGDLELQLRSTSDPVGHVS